MDPIDALMREHRAIEHVLATLSRASELGRSGAAVPGFEARAIAIASMLEQVPSAR